MMGLSKIRQLFNISKRQRGQVFILATLVIVVYTVSMIAVVTELSIDRTKTDDIDLPHMVDEYISEMDFQLQLQLFSYISNTSFTPNDIILGLQTFISTFTLYAFQKGVGATINLRLDEFSYNAYYNTTNGVVALSPNFDNTTYVYINSSILFQSSNSGSKISGTFNHYFGLNMYISGSNPNTLMLTQRDAKGNILKFISGAVFTSPLPMIDENNGNYTFTGTLNNQHLDLRLPSGLQLVT